MGVRSRARPGLGLFLSLCLGLAACGDGDAGAGDGAAALAASDAPPPLAGVSAPDFDGAAALRLLEQQVAFGPRVPGLPGHADQLAWMEEWLRERADTLILQPFLHTTAGGRTLRLTNLFARFRPEADQRILVLAHWDTRSIAEHDPNPALRDEPIPGANDGASGTALLLHLADLLARQPPPVGVDILLVDGEDYAPGEMYLGATWFAQNPPVPDYSPRYGVLVDLIADSDPVYPVEGNSARYAPDVVRRVYALAAELGYGEQFPVVQGPTLTDDHIPLNEAGIPTIDIIDFDFGPANILWHTHGDDIGAVSVKGLEAVGTVVTELIYRGG
ncbi:MAG TPA: M28 family peptidase [Longimicrobiales bacterium]|nr:M28 family peptidase [Longimicrobiales bacterium]